MVFENPLTERFTGNGPAILKIELFRDASTLAIAGYRRDAVHHAVWKCHLTSDERSDSRVDKIGQSNDSISCNVSIAGKVVARHDGEWFDASGLAPLQGGHQNAEHTAWIVGVCRIINNAGMRGIKPACSWVDAIATFRNRQRDDSNGRIVESLNDACAIGPDRQVVHHGTGDTGPECPWFQFDDRREPVLRLKRLAHRPVARLNSSAEDSPVEVAPVVKQVVQ